MNCWRLSKRVGRGVARSYSGDGCVGCFASLMLYSMAFIIVVMGLGILMSVLGSLGL